MIARTLATALFFGTFGKHPVEQSRKAVDTLTTWLLIANSALVIDLLASSGLMVACRSKRCSGKKRAMMGAGWPLLKSSLGGVRRDTTGWADTYALVSSKPTRVESVRDGELFFMVVFIFCKKINGQVNEVGTKTLCRLNLHVFPLAKYLLKLWGRLYGEPPSWLGLNPTSPKQWKLVDR